MERLTEKDDNGYKLVLKNAVECVGEDVKEWSISTSTTGTQTIRGYAVDKLAEYEDLQEQNKILILPCAVGDTVWDNDFGVPCSYTVTGFSFGKIDDDEESDIEGLWMYYRNRIGICCSCAVSEIGKTVFLTREQAKAELKKNEEAEKALKRV